MKIITGENIQDLCRVSISKKEHKVLESQNQLDSIDIDNFNFDNFDNPSLVYVNSSLINNTKPKLLESKLYEKLNKFKNPFDLILHNSDDSFDDIHLKYFDIKNIKRIFTQNINTNHKKLFPLPIGLANSMWDFGDIEYFSSHLDNLPEQHKFIYFNFTVNGGARDEYRPQCYKAAIEKGIELSPGYKFDKYVKELARYRYCLSPEGNGIDCHRMWECLYLKVVPICHRNILTEYFSKLFPIILVDDWNDLDLEYLDKDYKPDWSNYHLLDLNNYIKFIKLYG
jgi:hypothetical protein